MAAPAWNRIEVSVAGTVVRGRYRLQGEILVLEWRGGRHEAHCGFLKPEVAAGSALKHLAASA